MMKMSRILAVFAMLPVLAATAWADEAKIFKAGAQAEILLTTVAEIMIATGMCSVGDREEWQRVVTAVDRRYRFCAAKDAAWSKLLDGFSEPEKQSIAQDPSRPFASVAVDAFLNTRGAEARAMGEQAYCAKLPWKLLLMPGAATAEAKAEFLKANPGATLDSALAFFAYIRNLGTDAAWVEAPCDKDFWPPFAGNKR
jgi:hypothetical protein